MLVFILILVVVAIAMLIHGNVYGRSTVEKGFEQNDIVLLRRAYKQRYPHIRLGSPMRVVGIDGDSIEVTLMSTKDISKERIDMGAVKKVS